MSDSGKFFELDAGRVHYVDEGQGPPVVFVHGNPSHGAEFETVINAVKDSKRCIAPDHLGFGQSDKPEDWDYLPESHARNLRELLDDLDLNDVTMVVGDWGGPIGLAWCLDNPDRVSKIVLMNTWCWSVKASLHYQGFSKVMGGPIGRSLIRQKNIFATQVVKKAWGSRTPLSPSLHRTFTDVHAIPAERKGMWVFPKQIVGSSAWLSTLWEQRSVLRQFDVSIVWGMQDIAFRPDVLEKWRANLPDAQVIELDDVGHFPALEAADEVAACLR